MRVLDLRTRINRQDIILNSPDRISSFIFDLNCLGDSVVDTSYSFKIYKDGEEVRDLSNLIVSDEYSNQIKMYKDTDTTIDSGVYTYVIENNTKSNLNFDFISEGKIVIR